MAEIADNHDGSQGDDGGSANQLPRNRRRSDQVDAEANGRGGMIGRGAGVLTGAPTDPSTARQILVLLFVTAAVLGMASLSVPNGGFEADTGVIVPSALGLAAAALLWLAGDHCRAWTLHALLAAGTAMIGATVFFGGSAAPGYGVLFVWVALYAAYFFSAPAAAAHIVLTLVAYGVAYGFGDHPMGLGTPWLYTAGTSIIVGLLVHELVAQVRKRADDLVQVATVARELTRAGVDASDVRARICTAVQRTTDADAASLFLPDGNGQLVEAERGGAALLPDGIGLDDPKSVAVKAFTDGTAQFVGDLTDAEGVPPHLARDLRLRSGVWQPVLLGDEPIGVLALAWRRKLLRLSDHIGFVARLYTAEAAVAIARAEQHAELSEMAVTDKLTGLPNRRAFDFSLAEHILDARRFRQPLSLAIIDLDKFKPFNDTRGHQEGDELLATAARVWKALLRRSDQLYRWGGDEFAALLPGTPGEAAMMVCRRIGAATPYEQTASIGVADLAEGDSAETLLSRADAALYRVKEAGGADVQVELAETPVMPAEESPEPAVEARR